MAITSALAVELPSSIVVKKGAVCVVVRPSSGQQGKEVPVLNLGKVASGIIPGVLSSHLDSDRRTFVQSGAGGPGWLGLAIATTRGPKSRRAGRHCWPTDAARARAPNGVGGLAIPGARPAPTTELGDTVVAWAATRWRRGRRGLDWGVD